MPGPPSCILRQSLSLNPEHTDLARRAGQYTLTNHLSLISIQYHHADFYVCAEDSGPQTASILPTEWFS